MPRVPTYLMRLLHPCKLEERMHARWLQQSLRHPPLAHPLVRVARKPEEEDRVGGTWQRREGKVDAANAEEDVGAVDNVWVVAVT